jgi:hypothetical protein
MCHIPKGLIENYLCQPVTVIAERVAQLWLILSTLLLACPPATGLVMS